MRKLSPTNYGTNEQITNSPKALEGLVKGIPASLVQHNYFNNSDAYDFSMGAIHISTESMCGDLVITNSVTYDHFSAWGRGISLDVNGSRTKLVWSNYYRWIKTANYLMELIGENPEIQDHKGFLRYCIWITCKVLS